jgi:hypoxanthine phosphoribosyltransferase
MKLAVENTIKYRKNRLGMINYKDALGEILIPEDKLQERVAQMGAEISRDYQNSTGLLLICILRGGIMFLADLVRHISVPHAVDFMAISSYGIGNRESAGVARITMDLNTDIHGRDVLIIEDIIDSGHTIASVLELLSTRKPASLHVCTLLDKEDRREVDVPIRYRGFSIPNKFVFGYGLDLDEYFRNLPFIGVVDLKKYHAKNK